MHIEINLVQKNQTWDTVDLHEENKVTRCKEVYKIKYKSNETVDKYKVRSIAKGYVQKEGIIYMESFAPLTKMNTIRIVLALAT